MNYKEAKRKSFIKRIIGLLIGVVSFVATLISFFKMIYFTFDDGTVLSSAIANISKKLVLFIYNMTVEWLNLFWKYCPTPNLNNLTDLSDKNNLLFFILYLGIFIGISLYKSGEKLANKLKKIDEEIEIQLIRNSVSNVSREELESSASIQNSSLFQLHQLYIAPIIVGIILLLITKYIQ